MRQTPKSDKNYFYGVRNSLAFATVVLLTAGSLISEFTFQAFVYECGEHPVPFLIIVLLAVIVTYFAVSSRGKEAVKKIFFAILIACVVYVISLSYGGYTSSGVRASIEQAMYNARSQAEIYNQTYTGTEQLGYSGVCQDEKLLPLLNFSRSQVSAGYAVAIECKGWFWDLFSEPPAENYQPAEDELFYCNDSKEAWASSVFVSQVNGGSWLCIDSSGFTDYIHHQLDEDIACVKE